MTTPVQTITACCQQQAWVIGYDLRTYPDIPPWRSCRTLAKALRALEYARSIGMSLHVYRLWSDGDEEQIS